MILNILNTKLRWIFSIHNALEKIMKRIQKVIEILAIFAFLLIFLLKNHSVKYERSQDFGS